MPKEITQTTFGLIYPIYNPWAQLGPQSIPLCTKNSQIILNTKIWHLILSLCQKWLLMLYLVKMDNDIPNRIPNTKKNFSFSFHAKRVTQIIFGPICPIKKIWAQLWSPKSPLSTKWPEITAQIIQKYKIRHLILIPC